MKLSIPETWQTTKLTDLTIYVLGGDWGKEADFDSPDYTTALCIRGAEFRNWNEDKGSTASPRKIKKSSLANRILRVGDILVEISGGGPDQPVGRTVLIDKVTLSHAPKVPKICTNFVRLLRTADEIDSHFINLFLTFFYASGEIRDYQAGSNNLRNLKFNDYLGIDIPVPPLNEQQRIVAKIEELFSELDKGIENLKTARAQLKVYRQALLKHAFEGKLTTQWRAENQDKLETTAALLKRIQQERAQRYQQQLADWEASGKQGTKPKAPKPLPPLTATELAELPELPEGWGWLKVGNVCDCIVPNRDKPKTFSGGIPWITTPYLNEASIRVEYDDSSQGLSDSEVIRYDAKVIPVNSVVMTCIGNFGLCAVVDRPIVINQQLHAFLPSDLLSPSYLAYCIQGSRSYFDKASTSTTVQYLNKEKCNSLPIPVCRLDEQIVIVEILETKLSAVDQLDLTISTSLQQAEALRQSILKKAFSGQLMPQDPHDEPASALLARIKAERTNNDKRETIQRRTKKVSA